MIKQITLFCITLCSLPCISGRAQTFAPPGTEWYYDMDSKDYGVFHLYVSGDTVIDNVPCRAITAKGIVRPNHWVYELPTLYVYNNPDTVFVYNYLFKHFTPLYVFNVAEGDTIRLPIMWSAPSFVVPNYSLDSSFSFVVDSIRIVQYDTAHLKTVYTHPGDSPTGYNYVYGYGGGGMGRYTPPGAYVMSLGQINGGLIPACINGCGMNLSEAYQGCTTIRCYKDVQQTLKFVTDDCVPFTASVTAVAGAPNITVYPNPASGTIYISTDNNYPITGVTTCDVLGNNIPLHINSSFSEINADELANGIYYLTIQFDNQPPATRKVCISK